jgi:hypothetical protein
MAGAVAQLGERGLCKPEVVGSNPISSTGPWGPSSFSGQMPGVFVASGRRATRQSTRTVAQVL